MNLLRIHLIRSSCGHGLIHCRRRRIPSLGLALQAGTYLIVMYLRLPVAWLLGGRLLAGLSGNFNAVLAGCSAHAGDTSACGRRTFRVAVLEAMLGVAGMLASIVGGAWRRAQESPTEPTISSPSFSFSAPSL